MEIQSPNEYIPEEKKDKILIFLAGGITNCSDWQKSLIENLQLTLKEKEYFSNLIFINPRRKSSIFFKNEEEIIKQIKWEFKYLNKCDLFTMFFDNSKLSDQPICFYELGKYLNQFQNIYKNNYEEHIIISYKKGFRRTLDLKIQVDLATNSKIKPIEIEEIGEYSIILINKIENLFNKKKKQRMYNLIEEKETQYKFWNDSFNKYVSKVFCGNIFPKSNFKIGILGEFNVGKSAIMNWFVDGRFIQNYNNDIFEKKYLFEVKFNNQNMIIEFEDYNNGNINSYLKDKNCVLFIYDICKRESFEKVANEYLLLDLKENEKKIIKILVGNKLDRDFQREISRNEAEKLSNNLNIEFFEISVKSGLNMNNLFLYVIKKLNNSNLNN